MGTSLQKRLITTTTLLVVMLGGASRSAEAASPYGSLSRDEFFYCVPSRLYDCAVGQDAANWARNVTTWKFGENGHNDMSDAFRHCAWNGAMAQRLGRTRAQRIADNHEKSEAQPRAEKQMDLKNNQVGRDIGVASNRYGGRDTWGYVLAQCERRARQRTLYGLGGKRGAYSPQSPTPPGPLPGPGPVPRPGSPNPGAGCSGAGGTSGGGPGRAGFHVQDIFHGGTWARTDPCDGTWHGSADRPGNAAYWYPNGLGVGVDCARTGAAYTVRWRDGHTETWDTWFHVTDGKWFPSAAAQETISNSFYGLPTC